MPTTIYLVRHGETDDNVAGVPQGHRDVPINDRGRAQVRAVVAWFQHRPLDAVRSSPLRRALDLAEPLAAAHALQVQADPRLVEFDQGQLDGLPIEQIRTRFPDFIEQWLEGDPTNLRMPGGETYAEVQARMVEAIEDAATAHPNAAVALVSHNLAIKAALCHAMGAPLAGFRHLRTDLASVSILDVEPTRWWRVTLMNERCHVTNEGASWELTT
jgi:broad specificity phosphatase PhoE